MSDRSLNWLDKTIWALAKINREENVYNIMATKVILAISVGVITTMGYRLLMIFSVINFLLPVPEWIILFLFALCYVPIHFATHSSAEILAADLSKRERWVYTALGLFIFPISWGLFGWLLVWLESGMG